MFEACLVPVFENCFMFSKTRKTGRRFLVSSFLFFLKNIEDTKFSKQEKSSSVICVFKNYS